MNYALGILLQLIATCTVSVANIFDNQLTRKTFSSIWSLVVLNGLILIPLVPVLFFILRPENLTQAQLVLILFIACVEVLYQIPYYHALRETDTSVVVSLFSFQRIFIPIFAYFVVSERLSLTQYIGFAMIVLSSILITFKRSSFKFNKAIGYMVPVTIILSLTASLEKYGLNQMSWNTFFFWSLILTIPFYFLILIFIKSSRPEVKIFMKNPFKKKYAQLYLQNGISFVSGGFATAALSLIPVTIAKAVGSIQAIFVHLVASKGNKSLQVESKEKFSFAKVGLFLLTSVGIILTIVHI